MVENLSRNGRYQVLKRKDIHNTKRMPMEFFLNVLTEFSKFSDKGICHQKESNLSPLVLETRMLPQHQQVTHERPDL